MGSWICVFCVFILTLSNGSFGDSSCLQNFANVESSQLNETFISKTYLDLLHELTGGNLTVGQREAIYKSGDPFSVPAELGLESDSLNHSLIQFRELVQSKYADLKDLKILLLNSLKGTQSQMIEVEQKQKTSDKKNPILLQNIEWPEAVRDSVFRYQDWFVAMGGQYYHDKKGWQTRNFVDFLKPDGAKISVPFQKPANCEDIVILALNERSGDFYFSDRATPMKLWRATVFDEHGNPSSVINFNRVIFENANELRKNSIDGIYFSPDGKSVLFTDSKVVLRSQLKASTNATLETEPVWDGRVSDEKNIGFLSNQKIFTVNSENINIIDLNGNMPDIVLSKTDGYRSAFGSKDGQYLYVFYYQLGKKPFVEVHDVNSLQTNPKSRPEILDLGHKQKVQDWEDGYQDEIIALPKDNLLAHMYVGRKSEKGRHELRVWDTVTQKMVFSTPIKGGGKSEILKLRLSSDGKSIIGVEDLSHDKTKSWIWDVETLLERLEK